MTVVSLFATETMIILSLFAIFSNTYLILKIAKEKAFRRISVHMLREIDIFLLYAPSWALLET